MRDCQSLGQIAVGFLQQPRNLLGGPSPSHGSLRGLIYPESPFQAGPVFGEQTISDVNAYFSQYFEVRKEYLELKLANCHDPVQREAYKTRLFAIQANSTALLGSPGLIEDRLGLQTTWDFPIRGEMLVSGQPQLGVEVCDERAWRTRFWMGGWDGDLMLGFISGVLEIPLK